MIKIFRDAGVFDRWNWPWRNNLTPNLLWVPKLVMGRNTRTSVSFKLPWWTIRVVIYSGRAKWLTPLNSSPFLDDLMAIVPMLSQYWDDGFWSKMTRSMKRIPPRTTRGAGVLIQHGYLGKIPHVCVQWHGKFIGLNEISHCHVHCHVWPPEGKGDVWNPQSSTTAVISS